MSLLPEILSFPLPLPLPLSLPLLPPASLLDSSLVAPDPRSLFWYNGLTLAEEGFAETGRAVAGFGMGVGLSSGTIRILLLEGLCSSSLLRSFPLPLPPESSFSGLEFGSFRFFDGFPWEAEGFGSAGLTTSALALAVFEAGFLSPAVFASPESSESTTNSELSEGLGTVAGCAAFTLGFFAGNEEAFLGPAIVLEACELYPR